LYVSLKRGAHQLPAICFAWHVGIEVHVAALVAALDLKVVSLLRDAIRTADIHGAIERGTLGPAAVYEPRRHYQPEPVIEPRRHLHPQPVVEPRQVHHLAALPSESTVPCHCAPIIDMESRHHQELPPFMQPPWRVMPWQDSAMHAPPARPSPLIKVHAPRPDIISKGMLLDFFI
jgi:hypothetical protein